MRWRGTRVGDVRIVKKFAWWPIDFEGFFVWLEVYYEKQLRKETFYFNQEYWHCVQRSFKREDLDK